MIEPIQGNCCSIMTSVAYVQLACALCTRYGVMLIIDEVKSGFRVGKGGIHGIMAWSLTSPHSPRRWAMVIRLRLCPGGRM